MKKIIFALFLSGILANSFAQETKEDNEVKDAKKKKGFKKENLFTGGGLTVSFSNSTTVLGVAPVFGYSINRWIDAGLILNFNYAAERHLIYYDPVNNVYLGSDDKLRQFIYGPGIFARAYPINFLFIQVQGEQNFINQKVIFADGTPSQSRSTSATSFLVGAGYCNGREGKGSLFYYVSIMADIAKNKNSPYVEQISNGSINILPIIRAGLQVPLFQGRRNRR